MPAVISKVGQILTAPENASVVGAVPAATDLIGNAAWTTAAAALMPDVLPAAGTLLSAGGARQLQAGSTVTHAGHFLFSPDNTYDIGANAATRPRTIYVGTSVLAPLFNNPAAAATTLGNSTYGISSPGNLTIAVDKFLWTADGPGILVGKDSGGYYVCGGSGNHSSTIYIGTAASPVKIQSNAVLGGQNAALTLGNSTYGVTVPGAATFSGTANFDAASANIGKNTSSFGCVYAPNTHGIVLGAGTPAQMNAITESGLWVYGSATAFTSVAKDIWAYLASGGEFNVSGGPSIFADDVSVKKTSAQGYIYAYDTAATAYIRMYAQNTNTYLNSSQRMWLTSATDIFVSPTNGNTLFFKSGTNSVVDVFAGNGSTKTTITHDGTNGILSTSSGNLNLAPTGGTVAVTGAATTTGDISMSKTSAQGYIRAYYTDGSRNTFMYHNGSSGFLDSSYGAIIVKGNYSILQPSTAISYCYTPGTNSQFHVYNTNAGNGLVLSTDGTNAAITTFGGAGLTIAPASGTVAVTGGITASGVVSHGAYTVATLPSAGSNAGKMAQVTDSNVAASGNYGATVAAGGANRVKVFSDGTNWVIA